MNNTFKKIINNNIAEIIVDNKIEISNLVIKINDNNFEGLCKFFEVSTNDKVYDKMIAYINSNFRKELNMQKQMLRDTYLDFREECFGDLEEVEDEFYFFLDVMFKEYLDKIRRKFECYM